MEEELYTLLDTAASFPVAWGTLGEGTSTPRASIYRVGGLPELHMNGSGPMETMVQVDCYGSTYAEAITASRTIRTALEGYRGGTIHGIFLKAVRDTNEDDAQLLQRVSLTFAVHHR